MKISELIEKLNAFYERHGDLTVCVQHRDDGGAYDTFEVLEDDLSYSYCWDEEEVNGKIEKVLML